MSKQHKVAEETAAPADVVATTPVVDDTDVMLDGLRMISVV